MKIHELFGRPLVYRVAVRRRRIQSLHKSYPSDVARRQRTPCVVTDVSVCGPGVLLVVAVGVALGVFVGGILLTIAALFMKRSATLTRLVSRDVPCTDPRGCLLSVASRFSISANSAVSSFI